jgi:mRNA interferase MazF
VRGHVVTVAGGPDYAGKPRPAVIVQADGFDERASRVVVPLSTQDIGAQLFRVEIEGGSGTGLRERCFAMVDKIASVPLSKIGSRVVGRLSDADLLRINAALVVFLGIEGASTR